MLTSPAADDCNPWQAFRPIRHVNDNKANDRDQHTDDKRTATSDNGETRSLYFIDGNVSANTYRRLLLAESYDRKLQEYENLQITHEDLGEKYSDSLFEKSDKHLSSCSLQYSHHPYTVYGPSNKVSASDTCISLQKETDQREKISAFRKVYKATNYQDISADPSETSPIQNDINGNYFCEDYRSGNQHKGNVIECYKDDLIETVQGNVPRQDKIGIDPFSVYREHIDKEEEYVEFRKSTESIDSLCSISSEEIDTYAEIEWDQHYYVERDDVANKLQISKACLTFISTPPFDLSGVAEYQTAPSTPELAEDQSKCISGAQNNDNDIADILDEFFDLNDHGAVKVDGADGNNEVVLTGTRVSGREENVNDVRNVAKVDTRDTEVCRDVMEDAKLCRKCGKAIAATQSTHSKEKEAATENKDVSGNQVPETDVLKTNQADLPSVEPTTVQPQPVQRREQPRLQLPTPPFIYVDSLYYEADPESGTAKVIGRGSFGQVYKARFSDPTYYHLPIVVKEFNEEFSNSRDIIEEAQRLFYLQDTGYVPVCYGLLCFNESNSPRYGIVQEYIGTGLTLEQMLWDHYQFPVEVWLSISFQCCEGLSRFHTKGILLNDIKTNNIIMEFRHVSVKIKFIDFGLATDMRGKRYKNTKSLDTYVYLAPEVRKEGKWTNVASDIFSLGYMLGQLYQHTGLPVLELVSNLSMDETPDMRLPVQGASSLIHDSIVQHGFDPGTLCLNIR